MRQVAKYECARRPNSLRPNSNIQSPEDRVITELKKTDDENKKWNIELVKNGIQDGKGGNKNYVGTQRIWPARAFTLGHLTHNDLASVRIAKRATKSL